LTPLVALVLLGSVAAYSAFGDDQLPKVVPGVAAGGWAVAALALIARQAAFLPLGLAGVGAGYALFLALGDDTVDARAPLVAALFLLAAEFGFWSLEPRVARAEPAVLVRRFVLVVVAGLGAALIAGLLLIAAADVSGGVGLVALGVIAAVAAVSLVTALAARSRASGST
jgi:hypothetical protein